jgi:hypothetical protein
MLLSMLIQVKKAVGVIIRDYIGQCIAVTQQYLPYVIDAPMTEAYVLREGLELAQQIGSNSFTLQTNCVQVVETMNNGGFSATASTTIYDDCNTILSGFDNINLEHCNRKANLVAYKLAKNFYLE